MARPTKRRIEGSAGSAGSSGSTKASRSGNPKVAAKAHEDEGEQASHRYTPPTSAALHAPSPMWVPVLMFFFIGAGFLVIFLNYTNLLPGAPDGWYLIGGLGGILAGIITATQLR